MSTMFNTRRKKHDECLSVTTTHDSILWFCHHCEWQGGAKDNDVMSTFSPKLKSALARGDISI
jgi:hypothetical protein